MNKTPHSKFSQVCYCRKSEVVDAGKDGMFLSGARAASMSLIGNFIGNLGGGSGGDIGHRVVDQTGLTGLWDFTLEGVPSMRKPAPDAPSAGSTVLEAVRDQLGTKLKSTGLWFQFPLSIMWSGPARTKASQSDCCSIAGASA